MTQNKEKPLTGHTANPHSLLGYLCTKVAHMKPGECLTVDRFTLREIPSFWHKGAEFTPKDRVLGNIIGSSYTHSYWENPVNGDVTFYRHENTDKRYYEDPDQRDKKK